MFARGDNPFAPPTTLSSLDEPPPGAWLVADDRRLARMLERWNASAGAIATGLGWLAVWSTSVPPVCMFLFVDSEPARTSASLSTYFGILGLIPISLAALVLYCWASETRGLARTSRFVLGGCYLLAAACTGGAAAWGLLALQGDGPWRQGLDLSPWYLPIPILLGYVLFVARRRDGVQRELSNAGVPLHAKALRNGKIYVE